MKKEKRKMESAELLLKAVAIAALVLLALSTVVISVNAHMPGAKAPPAFELAPIVISDGGAEIEITIKGVHPEGFFELRKKVNVDKTATPGEIDEFRVQWEAVRDAFLTQPDWELFEGVEEREEEEPDVVGGAIFFSILVIGLILLLGLVYSRKKAI